MLQEALVTEIVCWRINRNGYPVGAICPTHYCRSCPHVLVEQHWRLNKVCSTIDLDSQTP